MALIEMERRGKVALLTINRPKVLNALNHAVMTELEQLIERIEDDESIHVLVITGAGRSFVAGADIGEMANFTAADAKNFSRHGNDTFNRLNRMPRVTIAAINGYALGGGCELAMACDIRIASEKAVFGMPEVGLGITPGFGGTQRLARQIGVTNAMELVLTNRRITAREALDYGLVTHVYPAEFMLDKAIDLAQEIAAKPQVAVRQAKQAMRIGKALDIHSATAFEAEAFGLCFSTEDQKDAMNAFLNKKKMTEFKNR